MPTRFCSAPACIPTHTPVAFHSVRLNGCSPSLRKCSAKPLPVAGQACAISLRRVEAEAVSKGGILFMAKRESLAPTTADGRLSVFRVNGVHFSALSANQGRGCREVPAGQARGFPRQGHANP